MIYQTKPNGFEPKFEVVGCFVEAEGDILLLLRQDHKPQPNTWGMPVGKRNENEERLNAVMREIQEETGFQPLFGQPQFYRSVFVTYPEYNLVYHIYHLKLPEKFEVRINPKEHKGYVWVKPEQALLMPLIGHLDECITMFFKLPKRRIANERR